jgi:serine phosphatase RsbU (regulator of sigma subunit)
MGKWLIRWLMRTPTRWSHMRGLPWRQFAVLLTAIFLLFSVMGFYNDLNEGGRMPYVIVLAGALITGLNAALWAFVSTRLRMYWLLAIIVLQIFMSSFVNAVRHWIERTWNPAPVSPESGIHFAATSILVAVIVSYVCFLRFMGMTGQDTMRIRNELELAHSIQKTLVPPLSVTVPRFEIYGVSVPSEKVGGDLVDVVNLSGGDTVAYLADIAGHGLQAGILMGMLKTAARTALGDSNPNDDGGGVLSRLMLRLNQVLPQVKEAHMYATFAALRLNDDGQAFYGMAASTPLLHWSAIRSKVTRIEEEQFPLGLLPVSQFASSPLAMESGDMVLIATDGILEVTGASKTLQGVEFGIEALENLLIRQNANPLPVLAAAILTAVRAYGRQLDDQTLLLVRRRAE